jgi:hypothetical protein
MIALLDKPYESVVVFSRVLTSPVCVIVYGKGEGYRIVFADIFAQGVRDFKNKRH